MVRRYVTYIGLELMVKNFFIKGVLVGHSMFLHRPPFPSINEGIAARQSDLGKWFAKSQLTSKSQYY